MRKMLFRQKLLLALSLIPALAWGQVTVNISSPRNALTPDIATGIAVTPIVGTTVMTAQTQQWPSGTSLQASTVLTFPAQTADYIISGFEVTVLPTSGIGFTVKQPLLLDYAVTQVVPAGNQVILTVNLPATSGGSFVVALIAPPPPPPPSGCTPNNVGDSSTALLYTSDCAAWTLASSIVKRNGVDMQIKQKLGWTPEITAQERCAEMVVADLAQAKQYALLKANGYSVNVSVE